MLSDLITNFKDFEKTKKDEITKTNAQLTEYEIILIDFTKEYKAINFFKRLLAFAKRKQLKEIKNFIKRQEFLLKDYQREIDVKKNTLKNNYMNQLIMSDQSNNAKYEAINERVQLATDLYNTIHKTKKAGDNVLTEIDEALSAIDSASTMETIDMFTSNKGISLLSSMSTSDAKSEVDDVSPAIEKFKKELEHTRLKVNDVQLDSTWATLDLIFDMADVGFMDMFSSFMVLDSLNNTESKLKDVEKTIKKIMESVNKDYAEIKSQLQDEQKIKDVFLENIKIKAKMELNAIGISI